MLSLHPLLLRTFPAALFLLGTPSLVAQAGITADRPTGLSVFAEATAVHLDLVRGTDAGLTLGGLLTFHNRWRLDPSFELRGTLSHGPDITETSGAFGFRLEHPIGRLHLFGNLLGGLGQVHFMHPSLGPDGRPYSHDGSVVFQYGGGLQFDLSPSFAAQASFQQQQWNLGPNPNLPFSPTLTSLGITYHIPFHPHPSR